MKEVVVFGGSGFLGSYVVDQLLDRGYSVTVADRHKPKRESIKFLYCDILNPKTFIDILVDVDIVYNFAALAEIDQASALPVDTININVLGNLNILEACKEKNVKHFIYASSAYALSNKGSFYGISKYTSEKLTEEYQKKYGLNFTIIRYGSLYGERANKNNFIYRILKSAVKDKKISVTGSGDELREYIHADDAAKLSVDILEDIKYRNEHIILTGTEQLTRKDLLIMINEILGNNVEIELLENKSKEHYKITPYTHHASRGRKLVANPFIDLGQGLVDCIMHIEEENK